MNDEIEKNDSTPEINKLRGLIESIDDHAITLDELKETYLAFSHDSQAEIAKVETRGNLLKIMQTKLRTLLTLGDEEIE